MTIVATTLPRVHPFASAPAHGVAKGVLGALEMLHDAARIHLVRDWSQADIVHTIGPVVPRIDAACRVHTVDRIPLRGAQLTPPGWWIRHHRRCVPPSTTWLAHGRTAGHILVDSGLVPGELVHCLPLLSQFDLQPASGQPGHDARSRTRRLLGVAPGMRLVVGMHPPIGRRGAQGWPRAVGELRRPDVIVALARICDRDERHGWPMTVTIGTGPGVGLTLADLLAAADVFVSAGTYLDGCCPGAAAVAAGVPVIAVTTDATAELVLAGGAGHVVRPLPELVAQALGAQLDAGMAVRARVPAAPRAGTVSAELARVLLRVYRDVLSTPAIARVGGAA